jgi:hypothetical protein
MLGQVLTANGQDGHPFSVALAVGAVILVCLALTGLVIALRRRRRRQGAQADYAVVRMTTARWLRLLAARGYLRSRGRRLARRRRPRDRRDL